METPRSARRYHCARCHCPVLICSRCDRGHIYCFEGCREAAYRERCQRNARRYRSSARGRRNTAQRQRRFRERNRPRSATSDAVDSLALSSSVKAPDAIVVATAESKKVTHRGSTPQEAGVVLPGTRNTATPMRCDVCQQPCSVYVRLDFLRTRYRHRSTRVP